MSSTILIFFDQYQPDTLKHLSREPAEFPTGVKARGYYSENKAERLAWEPIVEESTLRAYPSGVATVGGTSGFPGQPDL